jgi:hypothetical protein
MPQAVERGLRSQLALRLYDDGKTLGGLNQYSHASEEIAPVEQGPLDQSDFAQMFRSGRNPSST